MPLLSKRLTKSLKPSPIIPLPPPPPPSNESFQDAPYSILPQEEDGNSLSRLLSLRSWKSPGGLGRKKSKVFNSADTVVEEELLPTIPASKTLHIIAHSDSKTSFSSSSVGGGSEASSSLGFHSKLDEIWDSRSSIASSTRSSSTDLREVQKPSLPLIEKHNVDFKAGLHISPTSNSLSSIASSDPRSSEDGEDEDVELSQASIAFRVAVGLVMTTPEKEEEVEDVEISQERPTTPGLNVKDCVGVPAKSPPFKREWEEAAASNNDDIRLPVLSFEDGEDTMAREVLQQLDRMSMDLGSSSNRDSVYVGLGFDFPAVPPRSESSVAPPRTSSIQAVRRFASTPIATARACASTIRPQFRLVPNTIFSPRFDSPSISQSPKPEVAINVVPPTPEFQPETPGSVYSVPSPRMSSLGNMERWDNDDREEELEMDAEADLSLVTVLENDWKGSSLNCIGVAM